MSGRISLAACLVVGLTAGAAAVEAQTRFQALDVSAIAGAPGMRIVSVRDNLRNRCYLAFIAEPAPPGGLSARDGLPDVGAATAARDRALADLLHAYDSDNSVYAGTQTPNALKYNWLAETAQISYALTVLQNYLAQLEQRVDSAAAGSKPALAIVPDACAPGDTRATPP